MDSDIELWNSRRKKVVAEEDLDPADFEQLLLENRDAYTTPDSVTAAQANEDQTSDSMDLSIKESEKVRQKLLDSQKGITEDHRLDLIAHALLSENLDERLIIGILWDGSDSGSAEQLFHALPRSNRIVYLVEQAVSNRYLALEVEEIRRYTRIPVIEAIDGLAVLPGRIYLGPFMQQLTLEDGYIKLEIDLSQPSLSKRSLGFFSSIAKHNDTLPVAVIFDSSHDRQGLLADEADRSLVDALSNPQNKDLIYAETVNSIINAGGHVFFQDSGLHQSEVIITNDSGYAAAIKAPASEISVGLQRLLHGEHLDEEFVTALESPEQVEAKSNIKAEIKAGTKIEIDVQPTWETETTLTTEAPIETHTSTHGLDHIQSQKQETEVEKKANEFKVDQSTNKEEPVENEKVQIEKIEISDLPPELPAVIAALKSNNEALQVQNTRLEEENAELIEICQIMDLESEAANFNHFFGPELIEAAYSTLLLLDKNLKLRSFNRAAVDSILAVSNDDIGQSMFKLFTAKQVEYKEVRTLETQIQHSLDMVRTNYGEPVTVEINHNKKIYSINIVPMQAQIGKPIGVALSWVNL